MKLLSFFAVLWTLCGVVVARAEPQPNTAEQEMKRLEGTWKLISLKSQDPTAEDTGGNRDRAQDEIVGKRELIIKGDEWTERKIGQKSGQTKKFSLDPGKTPKTLDLTYTFRDKVYTQRPLYVLEGDTLKVLFSDRGSHNRPESFDDKRATLEIWERVKK